MLENILTAVVCFAITIALYYVVNKYRWHQLKCHVVEAINELNLWDKVNRIDIKGAEFQSITEFLDAHKYEHCFYAQGGAFNLFYILGEIRSEQEIQSRAGR